MRKKKVKLGPAARYGARYGMKPKRIIARIERVQRAKHFCPFCGKKGVKRVSPGIWLCRKCGVKFAGGAYYPETTYGRLAKGVIKGKVPLESMEAEEHV